MAPSLVLELVLLVVVELVFFSLGITKKITVLEITERRHNDTQEYEEKKTETFYDCFVLLIYTAVEFLNVHYENRNFHCFFLAITHFSQQYFSGPAISTSVSSPVFCQHDAQK
jgi:hypothetical protein